MTKNNKFERSVDLETVGLAAPLCKPSHACYLFVLWALWLSISYFGLGPLSFVFIHDTGDSALPFRISLSQTVSAHGWGYWDLQKVAGIDSLTTLVWPFQPDVMTFAFLPGWLGYGLITFLQRFVAGYFTFRLLTDIAALPTTPSIYAGLVYSAYVQGAMNANFSGFSLDNGFLTEAGLPLVLWALSRLNAQVVRSYMYAALVGLFFASTSWLPNAVYLLPMVFFWFLIVPPESGRRIMLTPLVFTAVWLVVSLPLIQAAAANMAFSHRADWPGPFGPAGWDANALGGYLWDRLYFVWRIILDNAWPLGLAIAGLIFSRCRDRRLTALLTAAILCLAFPLAYGPLHEFFNRPWAFMKAVNFDRVYLLVPFLLSLAAAFGLSNIPAKSFTSSAFGGFRHKQIRIRSLMVILAVTWTFGQSCIINVRNLYHALQGSNFKELYLHPQVAKLSLATKHLPPFRVATVAEGLRHPSYLWVNGFETADGYVNVYPKRYQEFWQKVISPLIMSDQRIFQYFHYWGSRVYLFSPAYFHPFPPVDRSQARPLRLRDHYNLALLSLANVQFLISPVRLIDENLSQLPLVESGDLSHFQRLGMLDRLANYVIGRKPLPPLFIYENDLRMPRFFPVAKVNFFDRNTELLDALGQADCNMLRSTAFLNRSDVEDWSLHGLSVASTDIKLLKHTTDDVVLAVSSASDFILIATNNYSPYWKAFMDGVQTNIFPANHAFQGLFVNKGKHEIHLRYSPPYFGR